MPKPASGPTIGARSARFLAGQRVAGYAPIQAEQMRLLPNIIRLGRVASLFGLDEEFLTAKVKTDSPSSVDELIRQFLHEVNDHHFPLFTDYWSDDETWLSPAAEGALPVKPRGFNNWHYDDPITLFMALAGLEEDPHPALDTLETDYPWIEVPWGFKLSHLLPVLDRTPLDGHLKFLPSFIRMVTRRTGSFFLDHSPEEYDFYSDYGGSIYWSKENVDWLKADWARAKPIHKRVWQLIDWAMADKRERTAVLMRIVLEAHEVINP